MSEIYRYRKECATLRHSVKIIHLCSMNNHLFYHLGEYIMFRLSELSRP